MTSFSANVTTNVAVNQTVAFENIVPIDLTSVFTGYGPLPAVIGVKNQTAAWDGVDQTRTVLLSDNSSTQERLTKYEHHNYFQYVVEGFTGMLRFFVSSAEGEWWFSSNKADETHINWRYTFNSKSIFAAPFLWFITRFLWHGYMQKSLRLTKEQIEHK